MGGRKWGTLRHHRMRLVPAVLLQAQLERRRDMTGEGMWGGEIDSRERDSWNKQG